jgi:alpha-beta hydrolase superfamily lysophospholipase
MNVRRLLAGLALVCVVTMGATMMIQDNLLYFPETATQASMVTDRLAAWPSPQAFRGLVAEPRGSPRGTAIVFHGNAGHAGHREFYARTLTRLGLRVILAEYPGYGPREGALGEHSLVADARQTIELAHRQFGGPLLLIGESLGAGVAAAAVAGQRAAVSGLLLITPWDRLASVAAHHYPFLPVKLLLRDHYDSVANLATIDCPIVVAVADDDNIVAARFGRALHESLAAPKLLKTVRGAGHNDWFDRVDEAWWQEIIGFLLDGARRE